jgi:hypothetical protein
MLKALTMMGAAALLLGAGTSAPRPCAWRLSASVRTKSPSVFNAVDARTRDDVWAVGVVASSDTYAEGPTLAEHWNGTRWRRTPTPPGAGVLTGVAAVAADDVWAVGARGRRASIEHWDGTHWRIVPSPDVRASALLAVAAHRADDVWAVGIRGPYADVSGPSLAEHWNGATWRVVPTPRHLSMDAVSVSADGAVWSRCLEGLPWRLRLPPGVSEKKCADAGPVPVDARDPADVWASFGVVAQWDGRVWHRRPIYQTGVAIAGLAAISQRDVWAAGTLSCCGGAYVDYLAHWNGTRWTSIRSVLPYDVDNGLLGISASSQTDVWAVGQGAGKAAVEHYSCART